MLISIILIVIRGKMMDSRPWKCVNESMKSTDDSIDRTLICKIHLNQIVWLWVLHWQLIDLQVNWVNVSCYQEECRQYEWLKLSFFFYLNYKYLYSYYNYSCRCFIVGTFKFTLFFFVSSSERRMNSVNGCLAWRSLFRCRRKSVRKKERE